MRGVRPFIVYELTSGAMVCNVYNVRVLASEEATGRCGNNVLFVQSARRGVALDRIRMSAVLPFACGCILRIRAVVAATPAC